MAEPASSAREIIVSLIGGFRVIEPTAILRPETKLLLEREYDGGEENQEAATVPGLAEAWREVAELASQRELLHLFWWGGAPGSSGATIIRAHELGNAVTVYTAAADYPDPGVYLIAAAEAGDEFDAPLLELLLTSNGDQFGLELFGGPPEEIRSSLPRERLAPLLVEALDLSGGFDWLELVEDAELDDRESDGDERDAFAGSFEEKLHLVERYLDGALKA